jgi:hypothetical protein
VRVQNIEKMSASGSRDERRIYLESHVEPVSILSGLIVVTVLQSKTTEFVNAACYSK